MFKRNQKGFTLIELMIVIAIIGILAAIAIPQFAAYRIRGFNSSGQSDVRNIATSQAAFFSDWQVFGVTATTAAAVIPVWPGSPGGAVGAVLTGPTGVLGGAGLIPGITITVGVNNEGNQIPLGNNVMLKCDTNQGNPAIADNTTFVAASKHINGDTYFAVDGDITAVYFAPVDGSSGTFLLAADVPTPSTTADDVAAMGAVGIPATTWVVR